MSWRGAAALLVLLALALASWYLLRGQEQPALPSRPSPADRPDYHFRDAEITRHDAQGEPAVRLRAERIEHYPQAGELALSGLRIHYTAADGTRWLITARRGRMPDEGTEIELRGAVHIERLDILPRLTADTDSLLLDTATDLARTEDPVDVHEGASFIQGRGMTLWLGDKRLEMHSEVRGRYES